MAPIDGPKGLLNREATSMQPSLEWEMGTFPRLKDRMLYEETGEWKGIMTMIIFLFNVRSHCVGLNEILNIYMPMMLQHNANNDIFAPILTLMVWNIIM